MKQVERPHATSSARRQIDETLRSAFAGTLDKELPDRFRELLKRMDKLSGQGDDGTG